MITTQIGMHGIKGIGIRKNTVNSGDGQWVTTVLVLVDEENNYTAIDIYRADLTVQRIPDDQTSYDFAKGFGEEETCLP